MVIRGLSTLTLIVTAACNMRCRYCYQTPAPLGLDWETAREAVDVLLASARRRAQIVFHGGEPLLGFPLIQRVVEHVESSKPDGLHVNLDLATNGLLLDDETVAFLERHRFTVGLSFDGAREAQDVRGPGTFDRLDALLDRLEREHATWYQSSVTIAITVAPDTLAMLPGSARYFIERRVPSFTIAPTFGSSPAWPLERAGELDDAFTGISESCRQAYAQTGRVPLLLFRKHRPDRAGSPDRAMCPLGAGDRLAVDVDGTAYACALAAPSFQRFRGALAERSLGALRVGPIGGPDLPERLEAFRQSFGSIAVFNNRGDKYSGYERCRDCAYVGRCDICPVAVTHRDGNDDPHRMPDFQCAFTRASLAARDRFPEQPR